MQRLWSVRRIEAALSAIVLGAYAYFYQAGGWNQTLHFDLTRAIVEQGTSIIGRYAYNTGDLSCREPFGRCQQPHPEVGVHCYSDKAPGALWLAMLPYVMAYTAFGSERRSLGFLSLQLPRGWCGLRLDALTGPLIAGTRGSTSTYGWSRATRLPISELVC